MPTLIMLEKYANALGKHIEIKLLDDTIKKLNIRWP